MFDLSRPLIRALMATSLSLICASVSAQNVAAGQSLYNQICNSCHGAATSGSARLATTPAILADTIRTNPQMTFLKDVLTTTDITNIAAYVASVNTTTPGPVTPAFNVTAMWWAGQAESGWGMSAIQSTTTNKVFVVIYTYASDRRATWFVLPDITWTTPTSFTGKLYQTTGPVFNSVPFVGSTVGVTEVGSLTMTFSNANTAALNYSVNGTAVAKTVVRQEY